MPVPHNNYVTKPRALNRFIDGVAELGASKALIKNKKFLRSDLIEQEKGHQNGENTSENEGHVKSSSDREVEGDEIALPMAVKPKTFKRATTILKTTVRKGPTFHPETPCEHCETANVHGTLMVKCLKCF